VILGLLVACVVWVAVAPPGRAAVEVAGGRPARGARGTRLFAWRHTAATTSVRLVVAHVASLLRAGAAPGAAWVSAAGVRVDQQGVPDRRDLLTVVSPRGSVEAEGQVAAVVAASRLAADVGAPLGEVLESIARALAAESEARADREASLAGPAATARVLLWLPLVGVLLGVALGVDPLATALGGGLGSAGLLAGAVLLLVGRRWSGRLVARARAVGAPP
jgi:tight adherence protein B